MRKLSRILTGTICGLLMFVSAFLFVACDKKCEHSFGDWKVTKTATCTQKGARSKTCTKCETVVVEEIKETGHEFGNATYVWSEDETPSCTATRTCLKDSSHVETETVVGVVNVIRPASCLIEGEQTHTATFSKAAFESQAKDSIIPIVDHELEITYSISDDKLVCVARQACKDCSHIEKFESVVTMETVVVDSTCSTDGSITNTFVFEDEIFESQSSVVVLKSRGHIYEEITYTWTTEESVVKCKASAVCIMDETHVLEEEVTATVNVYRVADCENDGRSKAVARFTNAAFSRKIEKEFVETKLGHEMVADAVNSVEKTCETDGIDAKKCSRCEHATTETIPAGHEWNDDEPTCTKGRTCLSCETVEDGIGHNMVDDSANSVAATCTTNGVDAKKCSRCSHATTETINATGHEYLNGWETYLEPTCKPGEKRKYCTNSGCTHFEVDEIAAIGHNMSTEAVEEYKGNCLYVSYFKCLYRDCDEIEIVSSEVRHSYNDGEVTTAPTCSTKGQITYTCSVCTAQTEGHSYNTEIAINPHAHVLSDGACTETGCTAEFEYPNGEITTNLSIVDMNSNLEIGFTSATVRVFESTIPEGTTEVMLTAIKLSQDDADDLKSLLEADLQTLFESLDVYHFELKNGESNIPLLESVVVKVEHALSGVDMIDNIYVAVVDASGNVKVVKAYYSLESSKGYVYFELKQLGNVIVFEYDGNVCEPAGHSSEVKYEFINGTDCANGVRVIDFCSLCEDVLETNIYEEAHKQVITLSDGVCIVKSCACGSNFEIEVDSSNLTERLINGNTTYKEYAGNGFLVYVKETVTAQDCTATTTAKYDLFIGNVFVVAHTNVDERTQHTESVRIQTGETCSEQTKITECSVCGDIVSEEIIAGTCEASKPGGYNTGAASYTYKYCPCGSLFVLKEISGIEVSKVDTVGEYDIYQWNESLVAVKTENSNTVHVYLGVTINNGEVETAEAVDSFTIQYKI